MATIPGVRTGPPARVPQSQLRKLEQVQERFLRHLITDMSVMMRTPVTGAANVPTDIPTVDLLAGLPSPACFHVIAVNEASSGLLYLAPSLARCIVEAVLGAEFGTSGHRSGELTALEQTLLQGPLARVIAGFTTAWNEELPAIDMEGGGVVCDKRLLKLDPHVTLLLLRFTLRIGNCEGDLCVTVPFRLAKAPEEEPSAEASEEQQMNILSLLCESRLQFEVQLDGPSVRVVDLGSLRPGDVFTFNRSVDEPLTGVLNSQAAFSGHILVQGGRRCFVVESSAT